MARIALDPDATTSLPGSVAAALAWRSKGQLHVTVLVKATFAFAPDGPMPRTEPQAIELTSDLAPYLGRADVLFTGSAFAKQGSPVRLAIFASQRLLLDKRLFVQETSGLQQTPVVLLGKAPRPALSGPVVEIPEGFDWASLQAAPPDQRIDLLQGDEWIVLEGLHPSLPCLRTRLPGARGRARVHGLEAFGVSEGAPLELAADTLSIDGDAQRCSVVWRRSFPVAAEAALSAVRVVAGVEIAGEALAWPDPAASVPVAPVAPVARRESPFFGTFKLSPEEEAAAARKPELPFAAPFAAPFAPRPEGGEESIEPPPLFVPPPDPAPPSPVLPPAAVPLGLRAASDAAAAAMAPPSREPSSAPPAELPEDGAEPRAALDLLWFDPRSLPRIRKQPAWREILKGLDDKPLDPDIDDPDLAIDPAAAEERREVFEILARGEAMNEEALRGALKGAVRRDGRFVAPLVFVEGEMSLPFDEMATLEAVVAVVGPLAGGEEGLKGALAAGREFLSAQGPLSSRAAAEGHSAAIKAACAKGKRALPLAELEAQIEEGLLDRRRYQRRAVFGGAMLRGLLLPKGAAEAIPAYLPEALAEVLPMFKSFAGRMIAEAHWPADQREKRAMALRVLSLARLGAAGG